LDQSLLCCDCILSQDSKGKILTLKEKALRDQELELAISDMQGLILAKRHALDETRMRNE
jgi:hypothetical protein